MFLVPTSRFHWGKKKLFLFVKSLISTLNSSASLTHTDIKVFSSSSNLSGVHCREAFESTEVGNFLFVLVSFDTQVTHFLLWHVYSLITSRAEGSTICCLPEPGWQAVTTPMKMHAHHPGVWGWHIVGGTACSPLLTPTSAPDLTRRQTWCEPAGSRLFQWDGFEWAA